MEKTGKNIKKKEDETNINTKYSFYSNGISINYTKNEMMLEFFQQPEKIDDTVDGVRIYLLPESLKVFSELIQDFIKKYEKDFGKIEIEKEWT